MSQDVTAGSGLLRHYYFAVGPLVLVESHELETKLSEDLRIRHMLKDDIRLTSLEEPFYWGVSHVIEFVKGPFTEAPMVFDRDLEALSKESINDVITSLRLFSGTVVFCPFIESRAVTEKIDIWKRLDDLKTRRGPAINPQTLLRRDFVDFWKFYTSVDKPGYLARAIHRFNIAIERQPLADSLIDSFTGLESIFLRDNKELSYRLANRAATLLAPSQERREVFKELKDGYNVRSAITHGSDWTGKEVRGKKVSIERLTGTILSYLRISILACLSFEKSTGKPRKHFDPADLDGILLGDPWLADLAKTIANLQMIYVVCPTCLATTESALLYCTVCGHILVSP